MDKKKTIITVIVSVVIILALVSAIYIFKPKKSANDDVQKTGVSDTDKNSGNNANSENKDSSDSSDKNTNTENNNTGDNTSNNENIVSADEMTELIDKFNTLPDGKEKDEVREKLESILASAEKKAQSTNGVQN